MDTITHGIAGALIGKAVFRGEDMFAAQPMNRGRIITWSLMIGAIFPDSDVFRDFFSNDKLLIVTWHRSLTHSLVLLPLWVLLLAGITHAFARWRKWEAPSFAGLSAIYAAGILSHILLDLVTAAMVAPRVGPHLHRRFHADRDFSCAAIARVGVCPSRKSEAPRRWNV